MMQCPTCGRGVRKQQEICSYCGSLIRQIEIVPDSAPPSQKTPEFARWEMHPRPPDIEPAAEPAREQAGETPFDPANTPRIGPPVFSSQKDAPGGSATATEPEEPAPRRPVPLIRVLVLLAFVLLPFINVVLRQFVFDRPSAQPPVFRSAVFCENISEAAPLHPKKSFSIGQDERIVFFSDWTGSGQGHALALKWIPPQGAARTTPLSFVERENESDGFSALSFIRIETQMPAGDWKTEVLVDGEVRATLSFELRD